MCYEKYIFYLWDSSNKYYDCVATSLDKKQKITKISNLKDI